jgi:flagellar hook-associated protein 3 FlgL
MTSFISTQSIASSLCQAVLQMQSNLTMGETELSTGNYADPGVTLGAGIGESISLQTESAFLRTITTTNQTVAIRLDAIQNILASLQSTAQDLLNSLLQRNSSISNAASIQALGQSNLQNLISSLNTSLNGDYIFAGTNTSIEPMADYYAPGAPNKAATDAAFFAAFGVPQTSSSVSAITGPSMQNFLDNQFASLFQGASWSGSWPSASTQTLTSQISGSQSVNSSLSANNPAFQQLAQAYTMIADAGTQNLGTAAYQAVSETAQNLLSSAIGNLVKLQANVGLTQSTISTATSQMSAEMSILSEQIGNLENIDPYEVATRVNNLQTQIQTAYSLTAQLQHLSLVNYL